MAYTPTFARASNPLPAHRRPFGFVSDLRGRNVSASATSINAATNNHHVILTSWLVRYRDITTQLRFYFFERSRRSSRIAPDPAPITQKYDGSGLTTATQGPPAQKAGTVAAMSTKASWKRRRAVRCMVRSPYGRCLQNFLSISRHRTVATNVLRPSQKKVPVLGRFAKCGVLSERSIRYLALFPASGRRGNRDGIARVSKLSHTDERALLDQIRE